MLHHSAIFLLKCNEKLSRIFNTYRNKYLQFILLLVHGGNRTSNLLSRILSCDHVTKIETKVRPQNRDFLSGSTDLPIFSLQSAATLLTLVTTPLVSKYRIIPLHAAARGLSLRYPRLCIPSGFLLLPYYPDIYLNNKERTLSRKLFGLT